MKSCGFSTAPFQDLTASSSINPACYDLDSTPDSWRYCNSLHGTVHRTGTTLHTGVEITNNGLFIHYLKNAMGAHILAIAAANAGLFIKPESCRVIYVAETFHRILPDSYPINGALIQSTKPVMEINAWMGRPLRISCSTPDGDVYGVQPVKFIP
jgi:hypothetical protein